MKTVKILAALIVLQISSTLLLASGLNSVYSKDGSDVWAVGLNGYVIHSTNAGVNWTSASIGNTTYNSVSANGQYVWIAGNGGILQLSSDNGSTWNQLSLAGGIDLRSVFFINSTTGWISGANGRIFKSTNSGLTWSAQLTPTINVLNCIVFTDNLNGAACGVNGTVLITTNGGSSWSLSATPVTKELLSIDSKGGTIFASGADATVIKSTNSGNSWSVIDYKIQTKSDVNSVFMVAANTYYSCGGGGFIRKSTDGGATFTFQINPMLADLYKIYFFNNNLGWAAGRDNNVVLRTTDGGSSWQMPAGTTQSFNWTRTLEVAVFSSSGNVFALNNYNKSEIFITAHPLGNSQKVLRSLDFGNSWSPIASLPFGYNTHGFIISQNDSNKFLVLSDTGVNGNISGAKIIRSSNYGSNWITTFTGNFSPDGACLAYDPNHPDTIYAGPTDSLLFRSTNFGLTWQSTGPKIFEQVCFINIPYNNSSIIFCNASSFSNNIARTYRSNNYGANWSVVDSIAANQEEAPFLATTIFNPNLIFSTFFGGFVGGVHKSTNLGLNWSVVDSDSHAWAVDFAKDDPNLIVYGDIGSNGSVEISSNGGNNFFSAGHTNDYVFSLLAYNRNVILSQGNNGFYRLNISYNYPIGIQPISTEVPEKFSLHQNYPNPFNPETKIRFEIPNVGTVPRTVRLIIYDALGREISTLVNEQLKAGVYEVSWNAANYPSGVYFYKLETENFSESKKMILIK